MPYGISCDLSGLCSQRLMSRESGQTGILPSLTEAGGGGGGMLNLYCDDKVYILPDLVGVAQLLFLWQFQLLVYSKSTQNTATGRGHTYR
jgi:hypothetical protein